LAQRLADELRDEALAGDVVAGLDPALITRLDSLAEGELLESPLLSFTPESIPADEVEVLWVFAFGNRFAPGVTTPADGRSLPTTSFVPGPVNEALAAAAAAFVADHPVPIIAQWEVARVLADLGIENVVSVEPVVGADGTTTYLSTAGVVDEGRRLAGSADLDVGSARAGVLCFADHAVRCVMTARAAGLDAGTPTGVELPTEYDSESTQPWTRNRASYIPTDLFGRIMISAGTSR
jgi:hypothetical protein